MSETPEEYLARIIATSAGYPSNISEPAIAQARAALELVSSVSEEQLIVNEITEEILAELPHTVAIEAGDQDDPVEAPAEEPVIEVKPKPVRKPRATKTT